MVKVLMAAQGSLEWHQVRRGIPTASDADRLITPKRGEPAAASVAYAYQLIAERILNASGTSLDGLPYLERGKQSEPEAIADYEFIAGTKTIEVGFMLSDCGRYGASPDRLISSIKAGVEVKSPSAPIHIGYLLTGALPDTYRPQVQMQMLVGELEYVDFFSWHPRCPPFLLRTHRDEEFIGKLRTILDRFCDTLDDMERKARALGHWNPYPSMAIPTDATMAEGVSGAPAWDLLEDVSHRPAAPLVLAR